MIPSAWGSNHVYPKHKSHVLGLTHLLGEESISQSAAIYGSADTYLSLEQCLWGIPYHMPAELESGSAEHSHLALYVKHQMQLPTDLQNVPLFPPTRILTLMATM